MSKRLSDPVKVLPRPKETQIQMPKVPKLPKTSPTKIHIVPAGTPVGPNWETQ
jgi:hypothetical protein